MTKIAIDASASGTGTFSLTAPVSNIDRTITLPDASGTVYTQGNVLGIVSQTGGVPTGAVIERGSNANGDFVRFADGTQICTFGLSFPNSSLAAGQIFWTDADVVWTYPAAFSSQPSVSGNRAFSSAAPSWLTNSSSTGPTATAAALRVARSASIAASTTFNVTAIGRWY